MLHFYKIFYLSETEWNLIVSLSCILSFKFFVSVQFPLETVTSKEITFKLVWMSNENAVKNWETPIHKKPVHSINILKWNAMTICMRLVIEYANDVFQSYGSLKSPNQKKK